MSTTKHGASPLVPGSPEFGWAGERICEDEWDRIGDQFSEIPLYATGDDGSGKTVRIWEIFRRIAGKDPDLTPQPTGNCVAAAADDVIEGTQCVEIAAGDSEQFKDIYNPYHYGTGRVIIGKNRLKGRAGSVGSWQAKAIEQYGVIPMQDGLPRYTKGNVNAWGDGRKADNGTKFQDYQTQGAERICEDTARVQTWEQLRSTLFNLHLSTIAANVGYTMRPGRDGYHRVSGKWAHQMSIWGYSEVYDWVAIKNQWGDTHGRIIDPETEEPWPRGFIKVRIDEFVRKHLSKSETIAFSRFKGFPVQKFDTRRLFGYRGPLVRTLIA